MKWEATTLLRKVNKKFASAITNEIIKNYPMRTRNFEKCTRDLRYIITAIEK